MQIKRNRFLFKSIWLAMIVPFILSSAGCVFGRTEAPYLDGYTEGRMPKITPTV
jgi:hypothetical protein